MDQLRNLLGSTQMVMSGWCGYQDPLYLAAVARTGVDAVTLDMQHGMQTENSVIHGVAAIAASSKPALVRIPVGRFELASKVLDAGAQGIIAPMINTVEDAEQLVSYTKYIPVGDRSYGPSQAAAILQVSGVDYVKNANKDLIIFAMIETKEAVENMEAIAAVKGIDGLFCGPGDLSISVRNTVIPDAYGVDTIKIVEKIKQVSHDAGKFAATWCGNLEQIELVNKIGFDYAAMGTDDLLLSQGANALLESMSFRSQA
ncbi:MAG: aldolase/citrate lyase family protein [Rhizobiaceae bacterium]